MSTKNSRMANIAKLNQLVQDNGNMNVLLVHAIAERIGLSASEFECWSLIADAGPFTAGELAKRCHVTSGGMTGMIDRLERAGFVGRSIDPKDRRRVLVSNIAGSAKVRQALKKVTALYEPMSQQFNAILANFTDEQVVFLIDFLTQANTLFHTTIDSLPEK